MARVKYPHMLPSEAILWDRWLEKNRPLWRDYQYDVHVGKGIELPPAVPENIGRMARMLTEKRIDVVAKQDDVTWIFEVKDRAGFSALGQLLGYRELYLRDIEPGAEVELAVVTSMIDKDMEYVFGRYGIHVHEV